MRKLSKIIVEEGITKNEYRWVRKTSRAIIIKDGKLLMVYSKMFNDYTFPGGGLKKGESYKRALARELKEEVGAERFEILDAFGQTLELRRSYRAKEYNYRQISKYFICDIKLFGNQDLDKSEKRHGVLPIWVKPEVALSHNEEVIKDEIHQRRGLRTALRRENIVLRKIIEEGIV